MKNFFSVLVACVLFSVEISNCLMAKAAKFSTKMNPKEAEVREKLFDRRFDDDYRYTASKFQPRTNEGLPWQRSKTLPDTLDTELFKDDFDDQELDTDYYSDPFEEDSFETFN